MQAFTPKASVVGYFFNPLLDQEDPTTNPLVNFRISQPDSDLDLDIHPFDHHKLHNHSSFNPKFETCAALNAFSKSVTLEVYKTKTSYSKFQNLPKELRQALDELKNNSDIIIKPADKGGYIVIQDILTYIECAQKHLSYSTFYRPVTRDLWKTTTNKLVLWCLKFSKERPSHLK